MGNLVNVTLEDLYHYILILKVSDLNKPLSSSIKLLHDQIYKFLLDDKKSKRDHTELREGLLNKGFNWHL